MYTYILKCNRTHHQAPRGGSQVHPVSITRFPLRRFSPGAGLLRNPFFISSGQDFPGAGSEKTGIC